MSDVKRDEEERKDEMGGAGAGNLAGYQLPLGMKKRERQVKEMAELNGLSLEGTVAFLSTLDEAASDLMGRILDEGNYVQAAAVVREALTEGAVREMVRAKVKEVVRKKPGGGGFALYAPNTGKKKKAKKVGDFPTKLQAKRAELQRFAPRDPGKLNRLRKEVDRLLKDPKKRAEKEAQWLSQKGKSHAKPRIKRGTTKVAPKKEGLELVRAALFEAVQASLLDESLFHEERTGSQWDDHIRRLSRQALSGDKRYQDLQRKIEKATAKVLEDAFRVIARNVDRKKVKLKSFGIKKDEGQGKTYLAFKADIGEAEVAPVYIYAENGVPRIELGDAAKAGLTKADPADAKMFRAELVTVQERVLEKMDDLLKAIGVRDKYLEKLEDEVDAAVAKMTPLQLSLLKQLLNKKYKKA